MTANTGTKGIAILALRLVAGWAFLFAGLQKLLGAEPFSAFGFLSFGTAGTAEGAVEGAIVNPTNAFWVSLANNGPVLDVINFIVPFGQVAIGVALILGLATRFASVMGTLMMLFFFFAAWEFEHGIVNQHLTYALVTGFIGYIGAGRFYGLDAIVEKLEWVRATPQLRYVLG